MSEDYRPNVNFSTRNRVLSASLSLAMLASCASAVSSNEEISNVTPEAVVKTIDSNPTVITSTTSTLPSRVEIITETTEVKPEPEIVETAVFPGIDSVITRIIIQSQNPEIGTIIDNNDIVYGDAAFNATPEQLGVTPSSDGEIASTVTDESKAMIIGGHSNASKTSGKKAAAFGIFNAERYPYANTPDDPGVEVDDSLTVETSDGFSCNYSIIDLRDLLKDEEFAKYQASLDEETPYFLGGVHPLALSPGVYGGKIPYADGTGLKNFVIEAADYLDKPIIAIGGSYSGMENADFIKSGKQSAWVAVVGAALNDCVELDTNSDVSK